MVSQMACIIVWYIVKLQWINFSVDEHKGTHGEHKEFIYVSMIFRRSRQQDETHQFLRTKAWGCNLSYRQGSETPGEILE